MRLLVSVILSCLMVVNAYAADSANTQLQQLASQAKAENSAFTAFNAQRGQQFFSSTHGNDWSCASCHTKNPLQTGKHDVTGKIIQPMAPSANPTRFTDAAKTQKWFKRNCKDVVGRECTAQEKGDVLTWLISLK